MPKRTLSALLMALTLTSCAPALTSLGSALLGGGGPKVAANGQAGKTNLQTLGQSSSTDQRISGNTAKNIEQSGKTSNGVHADKVGQVTVNQSNPWTITPAGIALAIFCWLALPSHAEMAAGLRALVASLFRRKRSA